MLPSHQDMRNFLDAHDIAFNELTLQEKHLVRNCALNDLKEVLQRRGRLLCPSLQYHTYPETHEEHAQNIADVIDDDIFKTLQAEQAPPVGAEEYVVFPEVDWAEWDGVLPPDAEIFFDDGEFAFYRTKGSDKIGIYVTESQSDPVETDEEETDIRTMIRVLDNMTFVLEEIRTNLVRML